MFNINIQRNEVVNYINKVNGGRLSRQGVSACLVPILLFGIIFFYCVKTGLTHFSIIPLVVSLILLVFYLVNTKKDESITRRLLNQFLFVFLLSSGSFFLSLICAGHIENDRLLWILSIIGVYFATIIIYLSVDFLNLKIGKYKSAKKKPQLNFLYYTIIPIGLVLMRLLKHLNNYDIIAPYILVAIMFLLAIVCIPLFSNVFRIFLAKKYDIRINEICIIEPKERSKMQINPKRVCISTAIGILFFVMCFLTDNAAISSSIITFSFCLLIVFIFSAIVLISSFLKVSNTKSSILYIVISYSTSLLIFLVAKPLNSTDLTIGLKYDSNNSIFLISFLFNVFVTIIASLIISGIKKKKR